MTKVTWKSLAAGSGESKRVCSGPLIHGTTRFEAPLQAALHAHRAVWLASQLEAPSWGSVQSYDGCGMSAGLLHNTAVLPGRNGKQTQGTLWGLLSTLRKGAGAEPSPALAALLTALSDKGWDIAPHGVLVAAGTLKPITAAEIVRELTPTDGAVPKVGPAWKRAERWAQLFHAAFSDTATRSSQVAYACEWLAADRRGDEHRVYALFAPHSAPLAALSAEPFERLPAASLPVEIDVAMCIYHAFSVHNPAHARDALGEVLLRVDGSDAPKFAKSLVHALAHRTPRWLTKRYPRTRLALRTPAARALWPAEVIDRIAPTKS